MNKQINKVEKNKISFVITNDKLEIVKLEPIIAELSNNWDLTNEFCFKLNLVIEEVLSNIIIHGDMVKDEVIKITTSIENNSKSVIVQISDNSIEYNPLNNNVIPKYRNLQNIKVGGLGIHFIKKLSSNQEYERINDNNILTLKFMKNE